MPPPAGLLDDIARTFRAPYVPGDFSALLEADGYLQHVWPPLRSSVDTQGFLNSALYMADMALDAVEEVYEPLLTAEDLRSAGLSDAERDDLLAVLDAMHYVQPQLLLALAALAEAAERERVGGQGRAEPRPATEREQRHLDTPITLAPAGEGRLPAIAEGLGTHAAPDLYRAMAAWPVYLDTAWDELQHLAAYPQFRRRGRALYYYARSGARFLAEPIEANPASLRAAGLSDDAIERSRAVLEGAVPELAMMLMHAEAMRVGLGIHAREVVTD